MKYLLLSVIVISLMSCRPLPQAEAVYPSLLKVGVYADYSQKHIDISDLAEIVYIPLSKKTSFKDLSYYNFLGYVSENQIVSYTRNGDVELFDSTGKKMGGFNRQGYSKEEYPYISSLFIEKERQEIWIQDTYQSFKIYNFDGTLKRSITLSEKLNFKSFVDYSSDSLLCYEDNRVEDGLNRNPYPFYLLSKEDGGIRKLISVRVSQRLNNVERFVLDLGDIRQTVRFVVSTHPLAMSSGKAILADYSQDTVFCWQHGKTYPLFVRTPSVYASLPFVLTTVDFMTDRFLFFGFAEKVNAKDAFQRSLLYDFEDGGIYSYQLQNFDFEPALDVLVNMRSGSCPSNWLVNEMTVDKFMQYYREGKLKGKAVETVKKMKSTDTTILILYKFRE